VRLRTKAHGLVASVLLAAGCSQEPAATVAETAPSASPATVDAPAFDTDPDRPTQVQQIATPGKSVGPERVAKLDQWVQDREVSGEIRYAALRDLETASPARAVSLAQLLLADSNSSEFLRLNPAGALSVTPPLHDTSAQRLPLSLRATTPRGGLISPASLVRERSDS
jgi:hypothetical protein